MSAVAQWGKTYTTAVVFVQWFLISSQDTSSLNILIGEEPFKKCHSVLDISRINDNTTFNLKTGKQHVYISIKSESNV